MAEEGKTVVQQATEQALPDTNKNSSVQEDSGDYKELLEEIVYKKGMVVISNKLKYGECRDCTDELAPFQSSVEEDVEDEYFVTEGNGFYHTMKRVHATGGLFSVPGRHQEMEATIVNSRHCPYKEGWHARFANFGYKKVIFRNGQAIFLTIVAIILLFCSGTSANDIAEDGYIRSHHLHAIAKRSSERVGMWVPDYHLDKIQRHWASPHGKHHNDSMDLVHQLSNLQMSLSEFTPVNIGDADGFMTRTIQRRLVPAVVWGIRAASTIIPFVWGYGCKIVMANGSTTTTKVVCYTVGFILAILGIFGNAYTYSNFIRTGTGKVVDFLSGSIGRFSNILPTQKRDYQDKFTYVMYDTYKKSLAEDERLVRAKKAVYDANTGQMLTMWDVIMAHVHPIRHSAVQGYESTLWYENLGDLRHRKHMYVDLKKIQSAGTGMAGEKRMCEDSDSDAGDAVEEEECTSSTLPPEQGGSQPAATGIYSGYQTNGTQEYDNDDHLVLGNSSYANITGSFEGVVATSKNSTGVCNYLYNNNVLQYVGLKQFENTTSQFAGYASCNTDTNPGYALHLSGG